jgi:hypothetical protein
MEYKLVIVLTKDELEREVNRLLADGWDLGGDLIIEVEKRPNAYSDRTWYFKEMVRYPDEDSPTPIMSYEDLADRLGMTHSKQAAPDILSSQEVVVPF